MGFEKKMHFYKAKNYNFIQKQSEFPKAVKETAELLKETLVDVFGLKEFKGVQFELIAHNILCHFRYLEALFAFRCFSENNHNQKEIEIDNTICYYSSFLNSCLKLDYLTEEISDAKKERLFNMIHHKITEISENYSFLKPIRYGKFNFTINVRGILYDFLFEIRYWDKNEPEEDWGWLFFEWDIEAELFLFNSYFLDALLEIDELNKTVWEVWCSPQKDSSYISNGSACLYANIDKWRKIAKKYLIE